MSLRLIQIFLSTCVAGVLSQISLSISAPAMVKPTERMKMVCKVTGAPITDGNKLHSVNFIRQYQGGKMEFLAHLNYAEGSAYNLLLKSRLILSRNTVKNEVYLEITELQTEDSATYYCTEGWLGLDKWGQGTVVTVTSATKSGPTVFPLLPCSGSLSTLQPVTFGCLSTSYLPPPVDVTWNSGSITSGIKNFPDVLGRSGTYLSTSILTVSASDYKTKKYTCNVSHKATGQTVNKDIEVVGPEPKEPKVEVMQASCGETGSVDLVCLVSGYTPDNINIQWLLNGEPTSISPKNSTPYKESDGTFGTRSDVSVPKADWNSGDSYTCRVKHPASSTQKEDKIRKCPESGSSHPRVTVIPPSPKELLITKQPKVTCEVSKLDSAESLSITWRRSDGKRSLQFKSDPESDFDGKLTVKSTLRMTVEDWNSGKIFTCTVQHDDLASPIEKQIHKKDDGMTDPKILIFPPTKDELSYYDFVGVNCLFTGFSHKDVYVQWKKNGQVVDPEYYVNTEPVKDNETGSYIMYSRLIIEKSDWIRESIFTCSSALSMIQSKDIKIEKCRGK